MGGPKKHLAFVDDDKQEITDFNQAFDGDRFKVTAIHVENPRDAGVVESIKAALGGKSPDLFVLDLFFRENNKAPRTISKEQAGEAEQLRDAVEKLRKSVSGRPMHGQRALRKAYSLVEQSRTLLENWCIHLSQQPGGGLALLKDLEKAYPKTPKVFYSRKATLQHAKDALEAGALDVLSKAAKRQEVSDAFGRYCDWKPPSFVVNWISKIRLRVKWSPPLSGLEVEGEVEVEATPK